MRGGVDDPVGATSRTTGLRMIAEGRGAMCRWRMILGAGFSTSAGPSGRRAGARAWRVSSMGSGAFGCANYNGGSGRHSSAAGAATADGLYRPQFADRWRRRFWPARLSHHAWVEEAMATRQLQNAVLFLRGQGDQSSPGLARLLRRQPASWGQLGGMVGSIGGSGAWLAPSARWDSLRARSGALLGGLLGSVLPGVLSGTETRQRPYRQCGAGCWASPDRAAIRSSAKARERRRANNLIDAIFPDLPIKLGGSVDPSRGSVSLGRCARGHFWGLTPPAAGSPKTATVR